MTDKNNNDRFNYTYSADRQEELMRIRQKYLPVEEDKMDLLIKMDKSVTKKGTIYALILGVIGILLFGIGMCCVMVWAAEWFIPGIIIGIVGIALMAVANPIYNYVTKKAREQIAPEIIRLTDELLK